MPLSFYSKKVMVMVASKQNPKKGTGGSSRNFTFVVLGMVTLTILIVLTYTQIGMPASRKRAEETSTLPSSLENSVIESGKTRTQGIEYYHCSAAADGETSSTPTQHLVLLHGSAFTKENWKTSGILAQFCSKVFVTALDLHVSASLDDLISVLEDLKQEGKITLPVTGLVTPSASGKAIIEGFTTGRVDQLKGSIARWIPVACNALLKVDQDKLASLKSWPILAVYGDKDLPGQQSSKLLGDHSDAVVKELPGRHPCYLDSPKAFVETVLTFIGE
jgi:hypothetical protein